MSTENKDIANEMKKVTELDPEEPETIAGGKKCIQRESDDSENNRWATAAMRSVQLFHR